LLSKVEKFILAKPLNIIRWKKHGNSVLFLLFNYNAIYSSPPIDSAYVNTLLVSVDELCPQTPFVRVGAIVSKAAFYTKPCSAAMTAHLRSCDEINPFWDFATAKPHGCNEINPLRDLCKEHRDGLASLSSVNPLRG